MNRGKLLGVWSCRRRAPHVDLGMRFLPEHRKTLPTILKAAAVLAAAALPLTGIQPSVSPPELSAAEQFSHGAAKAFAASELGPDISGDAVLAPEQRSVGIPADTTAGWDLPTTDGRTMQLVPPGGLGAGQVTDAGQVVYPDAGAGFDVLAENTAIGKRMVTRISGPDKTRTVTMFVRTPADTVMLAHTNGFLTVNAATPQAQTVAMFAPSEVRDTKGAIVPSAYITQQLAPNLYLLSQVISPDASTAWPVYADPFGFDIPNPITAAKNAISTVASAGEQLVDKAVQVAAPAVKSFAAANAQLASQAWSGIKAGANYVKENPLEFAQIVGGTALVATGVGTGFGAGLITSGVSGLVSKEAAANPDNKWLQGAAVVAEAATYIGPGGITKKGLQEAASLAKGGVENLAQKAMPKLTTKADDAAKAVVPTPPARLADEVAAAKPAAPGETPKAPNAPPGREIACPGQSFTPDTLVVLADHSTKPINAIILGDQVLATDPATGITAPQPVSGVWVNHDTDLLDLTITGSGGHGRQNTTVIHTTAGHPFHRNNTDVESGVVGLAAKTGAPVGGWTDAAALQAGDQLTTTDGTPATVVRTRVVPGQADMWDLTVENTHTFHLATTAGNPLVHNCTPSIPQGPEIPAAHPAPLPSHPADARLTSNVNARVKPRADTKQQIDENHTRRTADGTPRDPYSDKPIEGTPHVGHLPDFKKETADRMSEHYGLSRRERIEFENEPRHYQLEHGPDNSSHRNEIPYQPGDEHRMYQQHYEPWVRQNIETNPRLARDPTAQRRVANMQPHPRPESAAQQRDNQAAQGQSVTNGQRAKAVDGAHQNGNTAGNKPSSSTGTDSHHDGSGGGSHSKSNGSKNKSNGKGKGNRAKHARHGH
ncbi:HNH endonuclease [Mycobacteroides abscessus subsp. abscessus]|nr:HNH endonuclease [Mycobacteroides abscessus subsp. abscessus]SIH64105.1 HNH endonuclease [Mycobacteroides abscessus subsp. abscessus]